MDIARAALARGKAAEARQALERHKRQFPTGQLVEERQALWVQALAAAGQGDEARNTAEQFKSDCEQGGGRALPH